MSEEHGDEVLRSNIEAVKMQARLLGRVAKNVLLEVVVAKLYSRLAQMQALNVTTYLSNGRPVFLPKHGSEICLLTALLSKVLAHTTPSPASA